MNSMTVFEFAASLDYLQQRRYGAAGALIQLSKLRQAIAVVPVAE